MNGWKNYIILGSMFVICFAGAVHGSHDQDKELLAFSIDSAKQILAAILTVTTVALTNKKNGGTNDTKTDSTSPAPVVTPGVGLPNYPKQS
jgi:hypothetical protein